MILLLHAYGATFQPPASWSLGAVFGPGVGGMLVNPAKHYPGTFSQHGIFGRCWFWNMLIFDLELPAVDTADRPRRV